MRIPFLHPKSKMQSEYKSPVGRVNNPKHKPVTGDESERSKNNTMFDFDENYHPLPPRKLAREVVINPYRVDSDSDNTRGFTLLELSIVLIIIGLITAGIIGGRSLIHSGKVTQQVHQLMGFRVAAMTFQDKYGYTAGDLPNASAYWASARDGNGNHVLNHSNGGCSLSFGPWDDEQPQFFMQLGLSGIYPKKYDGSLILDKGYPAMKLYGGTGMVAGNTYFGSGNSCHSDGIYMAMTVNIPENMPDLDASDGARNLDAVDMAHLDTKLDDGIATTGSFIMRNGGCYTGDGNYILDGTGKCRGMYQISPR